jgi:NADPH:quinone reductase-like Zn-dependent oxidoreductase
MNKVFCVRTSNLPAATIELRAASLAAPADDEVLLEMVAAPINPADLLVLTGRHVVQPVFPAAVGIEGAGRIAALGSSVEQLHVGDLVAVPFGGTWAEFMLMKARDVLPVPGDLDPLQVAMLSVNPVTAAALLEGLSPGDWVIQNAANSAVGQLVIRLAAHRGIHTINLVRRAELMPALQALGADAVLVGENSLRERVMAAAPGANIRRGLDAVAGDATGRLYDCIGEEGELISYGLLNSDQIILDAAKVVFGSVTLKGYSRLRSLRTMGAQRANAITRELTDLMRSGLIHSDIEQVYPLAEVVQAVEHAARPGRSGKIMLQMKG